MADQPTSIVFTALLASPQAGPPAAGQLQPAPLLVDRITGALLVTQRQPRGSSVNKVPVPGGSFRVLAANGQRQGYKIWNASGADIYIKESARPEATLDDWSYIIADSEMYESNTLCYTGEITAFAVAASALGCLRVTELG